MTPKQREKFGNKLADAKNGVVRANYAVSMFSDDMLTAMDTRIADVEKAVGHIRDFELAAAKEKLAELNEAKAEAEKAKAEAAKAKDAAKRTPKDDDEVYCFREMNSGNRLESTHNNEHRLLMLSI